MNGAGLTVARLKRSGHAYTLDGDWVISVTAILSETLPGPPPTWGAETAADVVRDRWEEVVALTPPERWKLLRGAPNQVRDTSAARGTAIHDYAEKLQAGPVEVPEELKGAVEACAHWLDEWQIEAVATETPVANTQHKYAGTADLWAKIGVRDGARALIDLKSGKVQPKTGLQLAGYRYADLWQPNGPESEQVKPDVDACYVAQIKPAEQGGVRMLPAHCPPSALRTLAYLQQGALWRKEHDWWQSNRPRNPLVWDGIKAELP